MKSNLALACLSCNLHKGSDIASIDPISGELTALYDPRLNNWDAHFDLDLRSGKIEGKTPKGRATIQLLQFNTNERIEERVRLMNVATY